MAQRTPIPVGTVRTSEIVAALSLALDVTEGLPARHAARTCYLALPRPYRRAMAPEEALRIIDRSTGDHLAAEAVTALRDVL